MAMRAGQPRTEPGQVGVSSELRAVQPRSMALRVEMNMAKKRQGKPSGGRPPGRRGRGGTGPGPAYRPNTNTGGKKSGGMCRFGQAIGAVILTFIAVSVVGTAMAAFA